MSEVGSAKFHQLLESEQGKESKYVFSDADPRGKRAACVAGIIDLLIEADGQPVPYQLLLEEVGMDGQPAQMQPALHALEMVGVVVKFTFVESGKTKPRTAYAMSSEALEVVE